MNQLPKWVLPENFPIKFDFESSSSIEMVARLYGAMQTLIEEYNNFIDGCNTSIDEYFNKSNTSFEEFSIALRQEFQDFIDIINLKVKSQDNKLDDLIAYMKDNTSQYVESVINEMKENGEITTIVNQAIEDLNNMFELFETKYDEDIEGVRNSIEEFKEDINNEMKLLVEENEKNTNNLQDTLTERFFKTIRSLRAKVLALSGGLRNSMKEINALNNRNNCLVTASADSYLTIQTGALELFSQLRFYTARDEAKSFEITLIGGYGFTRTTVYSTTATNKEVLSFGIDNKSYTGTIEDVVNKLNEIKSFRQFTLNYIVHDTSDVYVTLTIHNDGFTITESCNDETFNIKTGVIGGTFVQEVINHGNAKIFKMSENGMMYHECVRSLGKCVVKSFTKKGGF